MKKLLLVLVLLLCLSGCKGSSENDSEYLFTSLGFDIENNEYRVTAEAVVSNGKNLVLCGKDKSLKNAFSQISYKSTNKNSLAHCGAVILGESVGQKDLQKICEYLLKEKITLSALVVKSENANKLLKEKKAQINAVGYDIMQLVEHGFKEKKTKINNRFYHIAASVLENEKIAVPLITISESGYYFEKRNAYIQ